MSIILGRQLLLAYHSIGHATVKLKLHSKSGLKLCPCTYLKALEYPSTRRILLVYDQVVSLQYNSHSKLDGPKDSLVN
jgi:hypothetical protein